jgi:NAD(P)-dependent dehydrogenase (short-subunit alcohol dehydrogenase family)
LNNPFELHGKRVFITGGTRGIGRAIALRFARAGASVIANYVRAESSADEFRDIIDREHLSIQVCRADITSPKGLEKVKEAIARDDKRLDGLVHCAATGVHQPVETLTTRHFDWVFALNIRAFFEVVKLLLPSFSDRASIVALSSQGAVRAVPSYSLIGSSKGALEAFSRHLAAELISKGIRVNVLSPGTVLTDAWKVMPDGENRIAETVKRTPLGRLVTPEEVAFAAQFLCSDASLGIIGHTLVIDGGAGIIA